MSQKPWQPILLHPEKQYLHEAYGISETRRLQLSDQLDQLCAGETRIETVHSQLDEIAKLAQSAEEFTFMVFIHAYWLAKKNALL